MIIKTFFKTPDVIRHALHDAVEQSMLADRLSPMDDGWEGEYKLRYEAESKKLEQWVKYHEYIWIEFDTDKGTATVVRQ